MLAMRLHRPGRLVAEAVPDPVPGPGQVLLGRAPAASAAPTCMWSTASCRHRSPRDPGPRDRRAWWRPGPGSSASPPATGSACPGSAGPAAPAATAARGAENLCDARALHRLSRSTAAMPSYAVADARFCFPLPDGYGDAEAAPLLCAGLIGYRALRMAGDARRLGLYGFGAAAHIVAQVARHAGPARSSPSRAPGDGEAQELRARARRGLGRRLGRGAARAARRGDHLRAGRRAGAGGARAVAQGRRRRLRRHPHERHPELPLRASSGGSAACARSPT